jgi:hypothetical protein
MFRKKRNIGEFDVEILGDILDANSFTKVRQRSHCTSNVRI